jgi:O-antigen/teichoic acid export membrane protein
MSFLSSLLSISPEDSALRRIVKNGGHLLSGNAFAAGMGFLQGIFATRLIGVTDWGLVSTVILFASNVNRLLSFRMSEVVVQRLGSIILVPERGVVLPMEKKVEAAATVKTAMLTEAATSILAFVALVALTPWAAVVFGKDVHTAPLFLLYGLILLGNLVTESSTGVLQAVRRFDWITRINIAQSLVTTVVIGWAFFARLGVFEIVLAFTLGKCVNGLGLAFFALRELRQTLGADWWKAPLRSVPDARGIFGFMLNSNLNGTVYLFTRDIILLILAALLSTTEVGYFKLAQSLINLIMIPLDTLITPTYAEISRTAAQKQWDTTLVLLRRVSLLTAALVLTVGGGLTLTGWFLLPLFYGADAAPAYPVLLILMVGYGFASIFQWNRPLFLALGKPGYPMLIALLVGLVELIAIFTLVPQFGYLALASILSANFVISIGIIVARGLIEVRRLSLISTI